MAMAQPAPKIEEALNKIIKNYSIIISEALEKDELCETTLTKIILRVILDYVPELDQYTKSSPFLIQSKRERILDRIKSLKQSIEEKIETNYATTAQGAERHHESPLVLLLTLALEKGAISDSRLERRDQQEPKNWGRLSGVSFYLRSLQFEKIVLGPNEKYWPGLPFCVMSLISIVAPCIKDQSKVDISFSASPDKFNFSDDLGKMSRDRRDSRLKDLTNSCNAETKTRIRQTRKFSESVWKGANQARNSKSPYRVPNPDTLEPHEHVPVYLPVVISTWTPDGNYLPACALDCIRFRMLRPPAAEEKERSERREISSSGLPWPTSCAEWDGFVHWSSRNMYCQPVWY